MHGLAVLREYWLLFEGSAGMLCLANHQYWKRVLKRGAGKLTASPYASSTGPRAGMASCILLFGIGMREMCCGWLHGV